MEMTSAITPMTNPRMETKPTAETRASAGRLRYRQAIDRGRFIAGDSSDKSRCYHQRLVLAEQIGQYRITGKIGEGGMGEIYSAFDQKLNRTVAVKVIAADLLDDRTRRRVIGEARAAAALDHPFICAVHDVLEYDGQPVIIMEWVQGETL